LKESNAAAVAVQHVEAAVHIAWQMPLKVGAEVGLRPSLAEAMLLVKQERIVGVAPPALSVSLISSQLGPGTHAPSQDHMASRFAFGVAPVHFSWVPVPNLNRTKRRGDSCPGAT
jgi:hypothetical protein